MIQYTGPHGTEFDTSKSSDGDIAEVTVRGNTFAVSVADVLAFAHHVQVKDGAAFWGEVDQEVDKERERREFIRRAAVALYAAMVPSQGFDRQVMGSHEAKDAWNMAEKLWGAKPEDA